MLMRHFVLLLAFLPLQEAAPMVNQPMSLTYAIGKDCVFDNVLYEHGEKLHVRVPCMNCSCLNSSLVCSLPQCARMPFGRKCMYEEVQNECCPKFSCVKSYETITLPPMAKYTTEVVTASPTAPPTPEMGRIYPFTLEEYITAPDSKRMHMFFAYKAAQEAMRRDMEYSQGFPEEEVVTLPPIALRYTPGVKRVSTTTESPKTDYKVGVYHTRNYKSTAASFPVTPALPARLPHSTIDEFISKFSQIQSKYFIKYVKTPIAFLANGFMEDLKSNDTTLKVKEISKMAKMLLKALKKGLKRLTTNIKQELNQRKIAAALENKE